ncbi:hypothetical protein J2858_000346 [Neorhizobium galegae]|uniref:hypothetical protein n=1 Tax=Rhizobium/Agrobacterium group TaxID=227290 RepID=UPI001AE19A27|nr:hypothetical protein [Neorhizobium galegae]MBP2547453.1 hypothetical protein [Neorhizobium galegae]
MRTIDQTAEILPATETMPGNRIRRLFAFPGLFWIVRRRTKRNSTVGLNDYQLRDIGLEDGREGFHDARDRARRQDELLREAHRAASMMAMGFGGR